MKKEMKYAQSDVLRCAATVRPSYCEYAGNPCCFSCDKNAKCIEIADKLKTMKPCKPVIGVRMKDGNFKSVTLFDAEERCEFSI